MLLLIGDTKSTKSLAIVKIPEYYNCDIKRASDWLFITAKGGKK